MKKFLLLVLLCGCIGFDSLTTGSGVYENFCGNTGYTVFEDKSDRLLSWITNSEIVIAVRNRLTGSMVLMGDSGDSTYPYLPEEVDQDDYLILVDKRAVELGAEYCDYSVAVNKRTNEFYIINTTKMHLLD